MAKLMRQNSSAMTWLEEVRQKLARMPSIDPNAPTILLCGYPNVGKTSFLNKVSAWPQCLALCFKKKIILFFVHSIYSNHHDSQDCFSFILIQYTEQKGTLNSIMTALQKLTYQSRILIDELMCHLVVQRTYIALVLHFYWYGFTFKWMKIVRIFVHRVLHKLPNRLTYNLFFRALGLLEKLSRTHSPPRICMSAILNMKQFGFRWVLCKF